MTLRCLSESGKEHDFVCTAQELHLAPCPPHPSLNSVSIIKLRTTQFLLCLLNTATVPGVAQRGNALRQPAEQTKVAAAATVTRVSASLQNYSSRASNIAKDPACSHHNRGSQPAMKALLDGRVSDFPGRIADGRQTFRSLTKTPFGQIEKETDGT